MNRFLVRLKGLLIFCYIFMAIAEWMPNSMINMIAEVIGVIIVCFSGTIVTLFALYSVLSIAKMIISGEE